jgi:O6-methylguanine-DNA--protein-cysteine methyltransferase
MTHYNNPDLKDIMYELKALVANIETCKDTAERGVNTSYWFDNNDDYKKRFEHALNYLTDAAQDLDRIRDFTRKILDMADDIAEGQTYADIAKQATRDRG